MSEHTPGPWTIKGPSRGGTTMDDGGDFAIVAGEQIIAEVICKTAASTFQPAEANAHLIAAAPDLLEALEIVSKRFHLERDEGNEYFPGRALLVDIDAAIAKACSPS